MKIIIIALLWGFLEFVIDIKSKSYYSVNRVVISNNKIYEEITEINHYEILNPASEINTSSNSIVISGPEVVYEESVLDEEEELILADLFGAEEDPFDNDMQFDLPFIDCADLAAEYTYFDVTTEVVEPVSTIERIEESNGEEMEWIVGNWPEDIEEVPTSTLSVSQTETIIWEVEVVGSEDKFIHAMYEERRTWIYIGEHNYPNGTILRLHMDVSSGNFDVLQKEELFTPSKPKTLGDFQQKKDKFHILEEVN